MKPDKTLRLIYPQWQGAEITRWIPEIEDPAEEKGMLEQLPLLNG